MVRDIFSSNSRIKPTYKNPPQDYIVYKYRHQSMEYSNLESFFEIYKSMLDGLFHTVPYFEPKFVLKKILILMSPKYDFYLTLT